MIKPTIHRNGTSQDVLLEQVLNAGHAINGAMTALGEAQPNARDYYPQGPEAIKQSMTEHESRFARLRSVFDELQELAIHIADAE